MKLKLSALASMLLLSACISVASSVANFPSQFSAQQITRDINYDSTHKKKLDIYTPEKTNAPNPVIVFFYGGSWQLGSKNDYRFLADAFTSRGYVVVIPDYVKYKKGKTTFPAWQDDGAAAIKWTHNNIAQYGGDANNVFVLGHSAGAHIAMLLTVDKKYGAQQYIKAFAGLAGPYHFTPEEQIYKDIFGPPENYKYMQAGNYVDGKQPPLFMLWGRDDDVVGKINIEEMEKHLKEKGGQYSVKLYDDIGHIKIIGALSHVYGGDADVAGDLDTFFKKYVGTTQRAPSNQPSYKSPHLQP